MSERREYPLVRWWENPFLQPSQFHPSPRLASLLYRAGAAWEWTWTRWYAWAIPAALVGAFAAGLMLG